MSQNSKSNLFINGFGAWYGDATSMGLVVTIDRRSKAQVLDALSKGTLLGDGQSASKSIVMKIGSSNVLQAAFGDLGETNLEALDVALGVTIKIINVAKRPIGERASL
jgi:hypothetical protein